MFSSSFIGNIEFTVAKTWHVSLVVILISAIPLGIHGLMTIVPLNGRVSFPRRINYSHLQNPREPAHMLLLHFITYACVT